jgi:hypothetical protein
VQINVPDNFGIGSRNGEQGVAMVVLAANPSNSRSIDAKKDNDSTGIAIRLDEGGVLRSRIKRMEAAGGLKRLDLGLSRSELI